MRRLYELTDGNRLHGVDFRGIGAAFGWGEQDLLSVAQYLVDERLAEWVALGGSIGITHTGVVEVEALLQVPDQPTKHLDPVTSTQVVVHGDNYGQIQAGTSGSSQTAGAASPEMLRVFLNELRAALTTAPATPGGALARNTIEVVEDELAEGRGGSDVVRRLLPGLRDLALGIASSGAFEGLKAAALALPVPGGL